MLVLPFLLGFRITCYYYRKAYYRSVWQSPTGCAVPEPRVHYTGETRLPLIIQNSHRYFFYVAMVVSVINTYDAIMAFHSPLGFRVRFGQRHFGGQCAPAVVLHRLVPFVPARYRGSAEAFLHILVWYWIWTQVSKLNTRHMLLAWTTLGTLALTDFYIMLVASGTITDVRFIG